MMRLSDTVTLIEVGPRDGFQNIRAFIPTETKLAIIRALAAAGIPEMELTSFVSPKAIPQMSDAHEVVAGVSAMPGFGDCRKIVLVPNMRGAQDAFVAGIHTVSFVISASASHNRANVNRTIEESLSDMEQIIEAQPELTVRLDVATAFGCPFEGEVAPGKVLELMRRALDMGAREIVLCDTIGVANPKQVEALCSCAADLAGSVPLTLHLHDTRGLGIANALSAMQNGITRFEAAAGGLGGCPFAPGAAGNVAMEDLLQLMISMEIKTGIDRAAYLEGVELIKQHIKPDVTGHMSYARIYNGIT